MLVLVDVGGLLARGAARDPGADAVADESGVRSHGELDAQARAVAAALARRGLCAGDRVAWLARNRAEPLVLASALARLGAVLVPLNWQLKEPEIAALLADSEAKLAVVEPRAAELFERARGAAPALRGLIELPPGSSRGRQTGWEPWEALAQSSPAPQSPATAGPTPAARRGEEVFLHMYTSGTTGVPKGALLTHGNLTSFVAEWARRCDLGRPGDRVQIGTPLFHVGALVMALCSLAAGARLSLQSEFRADRALDLLAGERVTHALFVPAMLRLMLAERGVGGLRFPALRLIVYGASPIDPGLLERALARFGCGFLQGYGLTETTGALTVLSPEDHRPGVRAERLASAGRALDCCSVRVVRSDGSDVTAGEVGEVVARGANVSSGYWKRPQENAECFRGGWFHTGDLATIDAQGYVTIVDRLKDMIIAGGEKVFPREVEEALLAHPSVAEAAVIGIPHAHFGEQVLALVVPRAGAAPGERELVAHCRARLATFKCPTKVEFRERLPRNPAGKLSKAELRAPYWAGASRRV
jgi:acyl-CoA synthetase (AMP-forming)/AMP-acid ligase II